MDFLYAGIIPALSEAMGMAGAMADSGLPYIISFTIQEDGRLIDGTAIHDAITEIDRAVTKNGLLYGQLRTSAHRPPGAFAAL